MVEFLNAFELFQFSLHIKAFTATAKSIMLMASGICLAVDHFRP